MIDLTCSACGTKLPVEESKLGTRLFVCPKCALPLEAPAAPIATKPLPAASEEKTLAVDDSALYIQQKLREVAEKRSQRSDVALTPRKSSRLPLYAGLGAGIAALIVGVVAMTWPRAETTRPDESAKNLTIKNNVPVDPEPTKPIVVEPPTVVALVKTLKEGSTPTRKAALDELGKRGLSAIPARPAVLDLLGDPDTDLRASAEASLAAMGPPAVTELPVYAAALRSPASVVRLHAIRVLGDFGQSAKSELVLLRVMTLEDDPIVKDAAEKAVANVEEKLLVTLVASLQDKAPNVRSKAAVQLAEMGVNAGPALPNLMEAMGDKNAAVRTAVLDALHAIGPEAVSVLGEALRDKNVDVRLGAIYALGRMGPDARPVIPDLVVGIVDSNAKIKTQTQQALERIGDYAIPYLASVLEKEKLPAKQKPYIEALARLGPEATPILEKAIKDAKPEVVQAAAAAIKKIEKEPVAPPRKELMGAAGLIYTELRGWFNTADVNKDGYLDKDELVKAVRVQNAKVAAKPAVKPGVKEVVKPPRFDLKLPDDKVFLSRLDRDNDGRISRDEYDRWAYDYAEYTKKELDEEQRIKEMQDRLREKNLSAAIRLQTELAIQQSWANYHAWRRAAGQADWLRRHVIARLPRR